MSTSTFATLASFLLLTAVAGCSEPTPPPPFPPRPVNVDVQGLNPCSMLDDSELVELGLRRPTAAVVNVDGLPSPVCTWFGSSRTDFAAQIIPADATAATRLSGAVITQVNGFGAVRSTPDSKTSDGLICQLAIDAAPGQTIRVQALTTSARAAPPIEEICRRASDVASKVMTTVVATAGR